MAIPGLSLFGGRFEYLALGQTRAWPMAAASVGLTSGSKKLMTYQEGWPQVGAL